MTEKEINQARKDYFLAIEGKGTLKLSEARKNFDEAMDALKAQKGEKVESKSEQ